MNLKGGTTKTSTSMFLAAAFSRRGRTLLVDCDPQGSSLSWSEGAEADGGRLPFSVMGLPTRDVHRKLKGFEADYRHVVLDTPPGDLAVVRSALLAADTALVAVQATAMDLDRVQPTIDLIAEIEPLNDLTFSILLASAGSPGRDRTRVPLWRARGCP